MFRRCIMNWDQVKGNWKQLKGKVKEKWGQLTDDDLTTIAGKRAQLAGKLQERYGYDKEQADRQLDEFARPLNTPCPCPPARPGHGHRPPHAGWEGCYFPAYPTREGGSNAVDPGRAAGVDLGADPR